MALSIAERDRRRDLMNDRRRLQSRIATKRRLSDEYKLQQIAAEDELAAVETELRRLEIFRRPDDE